MKKLLLFISLLSISVSTYSYNIKYLEGFYNLYVESFYGYPHDVNRNIFYLKSALSAPFSNPLYAIAKIEDEIHWEKYRYLMYMHINLKLVDSFLQLANSLDKHNAYFYNAPWKEYNIKSLNEAEKYYLEAKKYWVDALEWSSLANADKFMFLYVEDIITFEDESFMIENGDLDYNKIIDKHLKRLNEVRTKFENMDENTY
ncbi:hypothetical protein EW093_00650 [Thiospirochaeta perfilievii]|uniref:Uncharacterized protein n=1 Tax=Thiospirochaeta perfilievii TaxID=252967 RepID=A0A5C1Q9F4_9SPIO|nr:hypothetical protein [Thiospirochaeta perfilievii]QEN03274.1 hypothetical protein EW093_00650 [Thiospirochaeta perfilievii]